MRCLKAPFSRFLQDGRMSTVAAETPLPRLPVIVVEDDEAVLNAVSFDLTVAGYEVTALRDGQSLLDSNALPAASFLIVDHRMPRMDGLFLIEMLRTRGFSAPTILITSQPSARLRARCDALGVPIFEKPLLQDDLAKVVQAAQPG